MGGHFDAGPSTLRQSISGSTSSRGRRRRVERCDGDLLASSQLPGLTSAPIQTDPAYMAAKKGKKNKSKKSEGSFQQTDPLSTYIPRYPGDVQEYTDAGNSWRTTSKEKKNLERQNKQTYDSLRQAVHVHKLVRKYIKEILVDGMSMTSLCEKVEEKIRTENGGVAFPTNCSLNNVVAYWTPDLKDNTVLKKDDVLKVEFGTHIDGLIVDSAFTVALNPMYENLLKASLEALNEGIKVAGIDVRLCDVGKAIKEVMDSFEVEINGKTFPVNCIKNLNGHLIEPYLLDAGKSIPTGGDGTEKMEEGEVYAIKAFGSTGKGKVNTDKLGTQYTKRVNANEVALKVPIAKKLLATINQNFSTLPFCERFLERIGIREKTYKMPLKKLCVSNVIKRYPVYSDVEGSYVSQHAHTILLGPTCKEVLSKGYDY